MEGTSIEDLLLISMFEILRPPLLRKTQNLKYKSWIRHVSSSVFLVPGLIFTF